MMINLPYGHRKVVPFVAALFLLFSFALLSHAAEGPNLFQNGDFQELRANGTPEHWDVNVTWANYSASIVDSLRQPGEKALYLVGSANQGLALLYQRIPVEEGQSYVLRFWNRTEGKLQPGESFRHQARIEFLNEAENKLIASSQFVHLPEQVDEWTLVEHTFQIPRSTQVDEAGQRVPVKYIWVHLRLDNAVGEAYFASPELKRIDL